MAVVLMSGIYEPVRTKILRCHPWQEIFFFSSRRRHTSCLSDWSSDVCSSDLEWGGAVLMAFEYAPENKRGLYASIPQIGLAIGLCLASGFVALLSQLPEAQFMAWGWRVAFLVSVVLVAVGLYI